MGSRKKEAQGRQKAYFERRLEERLSFLAKKGVEAPGIDKDVLVKKLRANIRAINDRLKAIAGNEKRTEELAKIKAEKAALPPLPKDQQEGKGKKSKEAPEEGKEKKKKKEKEKAQEQEKKPEQEPGQEKDQKPEEEKTPEKKQEKKKEKKKEKKQEQEKEG
jgi:outer membrane biosynthesis protein TonB